MIRRLRQADVDLLREAWRWDATRPTWYRQADAVFNCGSADDLVAQLDDPNRVFIGVWAECLMAIIIIQHHGSGRYEGHLMARRGADLVLIGTTIHGLLCDLLDYELKEASCWVAERNTSVKQLCGIVGFQPDGVAMWRGSYRGRVIKWHRYSIQREQLLMDKAA